MATDIRTWNVNGDYWTIPGDISYDTVSNIHPTNIGNLQNPPIIDERGESSSDGTWRRVISGGYLRPITLSDRVIIGGTTFSATEMLHVAGSSYFAASVRAGGLISGSSLASGTGTITSPSGTYTFTLPEKDGTFAMTSDISTVSATVINHIPGTGLNLTFDGTDTYTISLSQADMITTGALLYTDWARFDAKLSTTNVLTAIKDLAPTTGSLIYFTSESTATLVTPTTGDANKVLSVTATEDGFELADASITSVDWSIITNGPSSSANDIDSAVGDMHTHGEYNLLESLTGWTNSDILNTISASHDAVTIGTASGLSLSTQELSLAVADTSTTGALSSTDWNTFNDKLSSTDLLSAISSLTLTEGSLIYGVTSTSAALLAKGTSLQVLRMNSGATAPEWATINVDTLFEVPSGFTSITNEIGDINNTNYPTVTDLNSLTTLEILQGMLFEAPTIPSFLTPKCSTGNPTLGTPSIFNGLYVENGGSSKMTFNGTLDHRINNPTISGSTNKPHTLDNGATTYTINDGTGATPFTNGSSVLFDSNMSFIATKPWKDNGTGEADPEYTLMSNGTTYYVEQYTGASETGSTSSSARTYTVVDPIYYGSVDLSTTYPTRPTESDIKTLTTKVLSTRAAMVYAEVNVDEYTGDIDKNKYILIAYPDPLENITLSRIYSVEIGRDLPLSSFTNETFTYTRLDSQTVKYRVYWALNSYTNVTGTVTLRMYF